MIEMGGPRESVEYVLGRMEGKIDQVLSLAARVEALEAWKSRTGGYIAGAGAVIAAVSGLIAFVVSTLK